MSAAVDYETFLSQATVACNAGASGIAVGRAVWQEAVGMTSDARADFLQTTALERLSRLTALCHALAKPWSAFYPTPQLDSHWYAEY